MSQAARSKSKDKKLSKEPFKVASKPSSANAGTGVPISGYDPLLGTFRSLDTAPHVNGRFINIDETDDLTEYSYGSGGEYETVPNNGSEWEDHKEKTSDLPLRQESILGADNDKREKIRQKNEKKHQRQKERRAQELHEKCIGYLMSRKLETLAEQLVSMGFSSEQATMALILNEGRVEESVAWLFEGAEEAYLEKHCRDNRDNLKIDISEEVARMTDMEIRYSCSKQDVERAVVTCEGNLEKAEDVLRSQKQEAPVVPPKPEETSDPPITSNDKLPIGATQNSTRASVKPSSSSSIPAKRDDKDFNHTKVVATAGPSTSPGSKNIPLVKKAPPKMDWVRRPQVSVPVDKQLPNPGLNPSVSHSLSSSLQVSPPPTKTEARCEAVGNELKNLQIGTEREPVMVMQRPQTFNAGHPPTSNVSSCPQTFNAGHPPTSNVSSSFPGTAASWYPNNVVGGPVTPHGMIPQIPVTRSLSMSSVTTNQLYDQLHFQQLQQPEQFVSGYGTLKSAGTSRQQPEQFVSIYGTLESAGTSRQQPEQFVSSYGTLESAGTSRQQPEQFVSGYGTLESAGTSREYTLWGSKTSGASQTQPIAPASSLGFFSSMGSNATHGLPSPVGWTNTSSGPVMRVDYQKIDWSLDSSLFSPRTRDMWTANDAALMQHYNPKYDSFYRGPHVPERPHVPDEVGVPIPGLKDGASTAAETSAAGASRVWTSPFEEKDLFSLTRQFVYSTSL